MTAISTTPVVGGADPAWRRRLGTIAPPLTLFVGLCLIWHVIAVLLDSTVFPTPTESLGTLLEDLGNSRFLTSLSETLVVLVVSYALAVGVGALVGFLIGLSIFWSDVLSPLIYAIYSIPKITLYPLFLVFLGLGEASRLGFAFVSGVIPMTLLVLGATTGVDRMHLKLAAGLGMNTPALIRKIVIPSLVPALVTGMRLTFGLTFLGVLIAELLGGTAGLGSELLLNVQSVRMGNIVGEVVLIAVIALIPTTILLSLERRAERRFTGERSVDDVAI